MAGGNSLNSFCLDMERDDMYQLGGAVSRLLLDGLRSPNGGGWGIGAGLHDDIREWVLLAPSSAKGPHLDVVTRLGSVGLVLL